MSNRGSSASPRGRSRRNSRDNSPPPVIGRRGMLQRRNSSELTALQIRNSLPVRLHGLLLDGKNPRKIINFKAPRDDRGFNATMWRDEDGTKLYLDNLDGDGRIDPQFRVTAQQLREMAERSQQLEEDGGEAIPKTIVVRTAGTADARLAAKKMVADMLEAAGDAKKSYILIEGSATPLNPIPGGAVDNPRTQVALSFTVTPRAQRETIIDQQTFTQRMGGEPKEDVKLSLGSLNITVRKRSELYKTILEKFEAFTTTLKEIDENTYQVETLDGYNPDKSPLVIPDQTIERSLLIDKAADGLIAALTDYIDNSGTVPTRERQEGKDVKKEFADTLKKQVVGAKADHFKNELDRLRLQRWSQLNPRPLTENQIVPGTAQVIGTGAQGDVKAVTIRLENGQEMRAAIKTDDNQLNPEAKNAGIPQVNPQQSTRAIAVYKLSNRLGLDNIPHTDYIVVNGEDGRPRLGQALEFVRGSIGQKKAREKDPLDPAKHEYLISQLNLHKGRLDNPEGVRPDLLENARLFLNEYEAVGEGQDRAWYRISNLPVDINYNDGVVQKGLSDLQVFDVIIGHADRHGGNYVYAKNDAGQIVAVVGIDNDDSLGSNWRARQIGDETTSKTPGVPPVVDFDTALNILRINPADIQADLRGLSAEEQGQAISRLRRVQEDIKARVIAGDIASNDDVHFTRDIMELNRLAGQPEDTDWEVQTWGDNEISAKHTEQNSYLGNILTIKDTLGTVPDV